MSSLLSQAMSPVNLLPTDLPVAYLRQLVNLSARWTLTLRFAKPNEIPADKCAGIEHDLGTFHALILINPHYHFSGPALARAICHELLELTMAGMWTVYADTLRHITDPEIRSHHEKRMRRERDRQVDQRLNALPFFTEFDIPIPRSIVEDYEKTEV